MFNISLRNKSGQRIKYVATIIDLSLVSLITAALIAKHGGKLLLIDQGEVIGGTNAEFVITDHNKKYLYQNDFYGFARTYFFIQIVENELNLKQQLKWTRPRIKFGIIQSNSSLFFANNFKIVVAEWTNHKFILNRQKLLELIGDLRTAANQNISLLSLVRKYKTGADFLQNYFPANSEIYAILASFCFFNMVSLQDVDAGFFIKSLINFFYSELFFPTAGINHFIQELLKINIYSKSNLYLNAKYQKGKITNNKLSALRITINQKSQQWIHSEKYIIGAHPQSFFDDVVVKKTENWTKYQSLLEPRKQQMAKLRFHLTIKSNANLTDINGNRNKAFNIIFNEHNIRFDSQWTQINVEKRPFLITNYTILNYRKKNASNTSTINITYLVNIAKWRRILTEKNSEKINKAENIYQVLITRLTKRFLHFKENIIHYHVTFPHLNLSKSSSKKIIFDSDGLMQIATLNKLGNQTNDSPLVNCILANSYANPGGHYFDSFETARNAFYRFDYKSTITKSQKIISTMNIDEILSVLQYCYCPSVRYRDKSIGLHFDSERTFTLKVGVDRLLIEECTFDEAFACDIYYYSSLVKFKYLIQRKTSLFFSVLFNSIRIRGGVFVLNRILRATNLNNVTQNYIYRNIGNIVFPTIGFPKTKLFQEELTKKCSQNNDKNTLF